MSRAFRSAFFPTCLTLLACNAQGPLEAEQLAPKVERPALNARAEDTAQPQVANGAPDPRLPIVGDPLGLLSRPPTEPTPRGRESVAAGTRSFDPGALMKRAEAATQTVVDQERDPRAVARGLAALNEKPRESPASVPRAKGSLAILEKSAAEVLGGIQRGAARPHVLFLYAAYCPGCREVLPEFLPLVKHYRPRGVQFTAASVDRDPLAYESYAPVLGGILPAVLIRSEGQTAAEMRRAGLSVSGNSFSIPLVALFDKTRRLILQGGGSTLARLPASLDALL